MEILTKFHGKWLMPRTGILGGTFDPVHIGHLIIADSVLCELGLDKVIFIPNGNPPHKAVVKTSEQHRFNMLKEAVGDNPQFEVSDIELGKIDPSYTVDTIKSLKEISPGTEFYFIMGADCVFELRSWHKYQELLTLCCFAVLPRLLAEGQFSKEVLSMWIDKNLRVSPDKFFLVDFPLFPISSTFIRSRIAANKSVKYFLPSKVQEYINKEGLYNSPKEPL